MEQQDSRVTPLCGQSCCPLRAEVLHLIRPMAKSRSKSKQRPLNRSLHAAKASKQDEFYTQLSDIEKELKHYTAHFKDKTVLCNCDWPAPILGTSRYESMTNSSSFACCSGGRGAAPTAGAASE